MISQTDSTYDASQPFILTGEYERDINAFVSKNPDCTSVRPWILYVGRTTPADERARINPSVPTTGTWIFGLDEKDARTLAMRFMEPGEVERSFAEVSEDHDEAAALGLRQYRYLAFDHTGMRVGAITDLGPADLD